MVVSVVFVENRRLPKHLKSPMFQVAAQCDCSNCTSPSVQPTDPIMRSTCDHCSVQLRSSGILLQRLALILYRILSVAFAKKAGFVGFFSNHSLRATAATRLFNANVEEQLVKLKTGHTSDAVQSYKPVSDVKLREMSDIVACKSGKLSTFGKNETQESTATVADLSTVSTVSTTCPSTALSSAGLSHCTFSGNINIYLGER